MEGTLSGFMISLNMERSAEHVSMNGSLGRGHLVAKATVDEIFLSDMKLKLLFKTGRRGNPRAPTVLTDETGHVTLTFDGCSSSVIHERPELLLLLHRWVLPRVEEFEDVNRPAGLRSTRNSRITTGSSQARPVYRPARPTR
jgi:hypothetical protein